MSEEKLEHGFKTRAGWKKLGYKVRRGEKGEKLPAFPGVATYYKYQQVERVEK